MAKNYVEQDTWLVPLTLNNALRNKNLTCFPCGCYSSVTVPRPIVW